MKNTIRFYDTTRLADDGKRHSIIGRVSVLCNSAPLAHRSGRAVLICAKIRPPTLIFVRRFRKKRAERTDALSTKLGQWH